MLERTRVGCGSGCPTDHSAQGASSSYVCVTDAQRAKPVSLSAPLFLPDQARLGLFRGVAPARLLCSASAWLGGVAPPRMRSFHDADID